MTFERQLSNNDIFNQLSNVKFNNENQAKQFYHISEQNWFVQYGNKSKTMLAKLTAKVKKGIKQGKYGNTGMDTLDEGWKRFLKPTKKTQAQQNYANTKEQTQLIQDQKEGSNKKQRRIGKEKDIMNTKAPSGRNYSYTEAHEGITSKRARAWRNKNNIPEDDI